MPRIYRSNYSALQRGYKPSQEKVGVANKLILVVKSELEAYVKATGMTHKKIGLVAVKDSDFPDNLLSGKYNFVTDNIEVLDKAKQLQAFMQKYQDGYFWHKDRTKPIKSNSTGRVYESCAAFLRTIGKWNDTRGNASLFNAINTGREIYGDTFSYVSDDELIDMHPDVQAEGIIGEQP